MDATEYQQTNAVPSGLDFALWFKIFLHDKTQAVADGRRSIHQGRHAGRVNQSRGSKMDQVEKFGKQNGWSQVQYRTALDKIVLNERQLLRLGESQLNKIARLGAHCN